MAGAENLMELRPYQLSLIEQARNLMKQGERSILLQAPTGAGKTLLTAHMLHTAATKGLRSWFVVHRRELIEQSSRAFKLEGLRHGIISAGYWPSATENVQIAGIGTLARRYSQYPVPALIVWDECHHVAAGSWSKIFGAFPNAYHIGLTATPQRLDGQGLSRYFKKMIHGPSISWLIENKFLSPYKLYAPATIDLSNVHKRMGDYDRVELSTAMDKPRITGSAVEHYKKYAAGKRAIVFAVSIAHSKHIVEEFIKEGFNAAHIDGQTPPEDRARTIGSFVAGNIQVLSNVELFGEGFDVPGIEVVILLRPTQSTGLYLQQVGRSLRTAEGKSFAVILDHVGNCERFGLPDQAREWSLEGREKGKGEFVSPVKVCQMCFGAQKPAPKCIFCGYIFPIISREVEQVSGTLKEVDQAQLLLKFKKKREQGMAKSFGELVAIGRSRKYKAPEKWAAVLMAARKKNTIAR